jgi:hypothetical protein
MIDPPQTAMPIRAPNADVIAQPKSSDNRSKIVLSPSADVWFAIGLAMQLGPIYRNAA